jgi:hypothetical protein
LACEANGLVIDPPLKAADLCGLAAGLLGFCARRSATVDGVEWEITLAVGEMWAAGRDPYGERRLEAEGCFLAAASWHMQVGRDTGHVGAERFDVVPHPDSVHPRVHRHPYGFGNDVRLAWSSLPVPDAWLNHVDRVLGGALSDGLPSWEEDEDNYVDEEDRLC